MQDLATPLSDEEFDRLNHFLLDRIDEEADTLDMDEGVLDMSELDGFFTAIVSGPVTIMLSQWLPAVWGECEPVWKHEKEFEEILALMMRYMNSIAGMLMQAPEAFEPVFQEREVEGEVYTIVDEWCEGYWRGVRLVQEHWDQGGQEMAVLLAPILAFTGETNWRGHDFAHDEMRKIQQAMPFVHACSDFIYTESLQAGSEEQTENPVPGTRKTRNELRGDTELVRLLRTSVEQASDDSGWAHLGRVGQYISKNSLFSSANYGYRKLSDLIRSSELFDVGTRDGDSAIYIKDAR